MYPYSMNFDDDIEGMAKSDNSKSSANPFSPGAHPPGHGRPPEHGHPPGPGRPPYDDHDHHHPKHGNKPGPGPKPGHYPHGEPPTFTPKRPANVFAVNPGAIIGCMNNYTYVWLTNGHGFWMYITFVGRQSVSGYRWGRFGWSYTGLDLRSIESFYCY